MEFAGFHFESGTRRFVDFTAMFSGEIGEGSSCGGWVALKPRSRVTVPYTAGHLVPNA